MVKSLSPGQVNLIKINIVINLKIWQSDTNRYKKLKRISHKKNNNWGKKTLFHDFQKGIIPTPVPISKLLIYNVYLCRTIDLYIVYNITIIIKQNYIKLVTQKKKKNFRLISTI